MGDRGKNTDTINLISRSMIYLRYSSKTMVSLLSIIFLISCNGGGGKISQSYDVHGTTDKVVRVIDGNTIELQCGLHVDLIGVEPSELSKEWLMNHVKGDTVILIADKQDPKQTYSSSSETVRAYVKIKEDPRGSINGMLLRLRKAKLSFDYCKDSLDAFKYINDHPKLNDAELFTLLRPSTFFIEVQTTGKSWLGTGFFIGRDGLALTNNHVLPPDADSVSIYYYDKNGDLDRSNNRRVRGILASWKADNGKFDVTLFKVELEEGEKVSFLPLIERQEHNGVKLAKLGNPTGETCIFQTGNLSKYNDSEGCFIHSCPSNPGDSGGPVVNVKGEVVGINQSVKLDNNYGTISQVHGIACAVDVVPLRNYMDEKGIEYGK